MSKLIQLDFRKLGAKRRGGGSSLLGLSWDGGRIEGVWLKRTNGSITLLKTFSFTLSLDPLTNDPALVGREIRNHLDAENVRERVCVVGLPLKWALMTHVAIPEMPEADVASFLQIEAERGFPCDVTTLYIATTRYTAPEGGAHATLAGIPRNHVDVFERVLRAAQLRPVSFSLGLPALQPPELEISQGVLALSVGETQVSLQVTFGGGIVALRVLEDALELEGAQKTLKADVVAREIRITLGQLPAALRQAVNHVRVFGPRDLAQRLADEIELRLESLGLEVELPSTYSSKDFGVQVPGDAPVSASFSLGARRLAGRPAVFEFLPPHVTQWQQFVQRYSSGRLQKAGLAAGVAVALIGGIFLYQQWQIVSLRSQWSRMRVTVTDLKELQRRTSQFRPWTDESYRGMNIMKRLAESFPEDGSVTAKILEIRDPGQVICTGVAKDYDALLKTVERLRKVPEIPDVSLGQTRGNSTALQFTLGFAWSEGGKSAN